MRKLLLLALLTALPSAYAQTAMTVDWEWKKSHRCEDVSPALSVSGIPEGTKILSVQMNDLDYQNKDHGGGTVVLSGSTSVEIPEGALKNNYLGPCPRNYASFGHNYQITVRALGADGNELGKAVKTREFSAATAK